MGSSGARALAMVSNAAAHPADARAAVQALSASRIREVANAGLGDPDVLPFWFGEPDEVTPAFIRDAAAAALARGETFYTQNLGIDELRSAIAGYVTQLHRPTGVDQIAVANAHARDIHRLAEVDDVHERV